MLLWKLSNCAKWLNSRKDGRHHKASNSAMLNNEHAEQTNVSSKETDPLMYKCVKKLALKITNWLQIETLSGFEKRQFSVRSTHVVCWHVSEVLEICKYFRWLDFSATATSYLSLSTHREEPRDMEQLWGLGHPIHRSSWIQQPEAEGERIPPCKYHRPIFFFSREEF